MPSPEHTYLSDNKTLLQKLGHQALDPDGPTADGQLDVDGFWPPISSELEAKNDLREDDATTTQSDKFVVEWTPTISSTGKKKRGDQPEEIILVTSVEFPNGKPPPITNVDGRIEPPSVSQLPQLFAPSQGALADLYRSEEEMRRARSGPRRKTKEPPPKK